MKIEISRGCTSHANEVDDKDFDDLSLNEQKYILIKLIEHCVDNKEDANTVFEVLANYFVRDEIRSGTCEQCGDSYYANKIEI